MEKKKPQIRFNGFTEDWEKKKLGELGKWYKGQPLSKSDIRECGTFPCIHYGELFSYTEIIREVTSRTNVKPSILSSGNDLLFPDSDVTPDGLGRCSSLTDKGVLLGAGINILQLESCVRAPFCSLCTNVHKEQIIERVTGTTVRHTKPSSLSEVVISISPSIPEQEKIGVFLTTLDKLIAKLEAKLDKLRKLKKALLEKMFINVNVGGYEAPQIRFKGYTDKWQVKELGEVAIFNPPNQPLRERFYYIDLESVEKGSLKVKEQVTKRMAPSRAQRTLEFNDILFQTVRPYLQNHYLFKKKTQNNQWVASTGYALLRPKIYPELLYTMLLSKGFMQEIMQRCTGSTYPAINSKKMIDIKVGCSSVQMEQQLIGDLFILLDDQLNKTSTKLTKLRNIKQSLLQKMFA